jgi:hypothetical protein
MKVKKTIVFLMFFVVQNSFGQLQETKTTLGAISAEAIYGSQKGFVLGIGVLHMNKSKTGLDIKKAEHRPTLIKILPQPFYLGIENAFLSSSLHSSKWVYSPQIHMLFGWRFICLGAKIAYLTDFDKRQMNFVTEIGLGWRYVFLKYQHNYTFLHKGESLISTNNIALQFFIPIK